MGKTKIILDCDVGHDDAIALMLAAGNLVIDLTWRNGGGRQPGAEHTHENTPMCASIMNSMSPCIRAVTGQWSTTRSWQGDITQGGLDGPVFPPLVRKEENEHAVSYIIRTLRESDGDITLVPTGPLTNIAMAMRLDPGISKIRQIVLMGGAAGLGNVTPAAEFNIYADPEAAHVVFTSGVPVVMMGLDVTNQALADMSVIERMERIGYKAGKLFGDIMRFTFETQRINGLSAGPVHDVTTVAWLIKPDLFETKPMHVEVDLTHGPCYGRTVCDANARTGKEANALVGLGVDLPAFWDLIESAVRNLI